MKMTDELETVMGGVRMGVNVDIKRTDGKYSNASLARSLFLTAGWLSLTTVLTSELHMMKLQLWASYPIA